MKGYYFKRWSFLRRAALIGQTKAFWLLQHVSSFSSDFLDKSTRIPHRNTPAGQVGVPTHLF